jgi:hypothetical protein
MGASEEGDAMPPQPIAQTASGAVSLMASSVIDPARRRDREVRSSDGLG